MKSFNGAVTFWLRKYKILRNEIRYLSPCFNGAVTFWLRKWIVRRRAPWYLPSLQWGRNFLVTEMTGLFLHVMPRAGQLQWGRNFLVTEIPISTFSSWPLTSFNGAVTFWLRKSVHRGRRASGNFVLQWGRNFLVTEIYTPLPPLPRAHKLQWGRNFLVTEIDARGGGNRTAWRASMGP